MRIVLQKNKYHVKYKIISCLAVVLLLSTSGKIYSQKKDKLLGEKNFDVELSEQGKKKNTETVKDQILFRADRLSSTYMMRQFTFTASSYNATVDSTLGTPVITFLSDSKNTDGDLLKWNGTVTGEVMEGTAVITDKKGKAKVSYTIKGQQKKFKK